MRNHIIQIWSIIQSISTSWVLNLTGDVNLIHIKYAWKITIHRANSTIIAQSKEWIVLPSNGVATSSRDSMEGGSELILGQFGLLLDRYRVVVAGRVDVAVAGLVVVAVTAIDAVVVVVT